MKSVRSIFLSLVLAIAASAVSAQETQVTVSGLEGVPPDFTLVMGQVVTVLRGERPDAALPVFLTEKAYDNLRLGGALSYPDFAVSSVAMLEMAMVSNEPVTLRGDYTMMLMDGAGRRASVGVITEHEVHESGILIRSGRAVPLFPASPDAELHYVPAAKVSGDLLDKYTDHLSLLEWARKNSVPPDAGDFYVFACLTEEVEEDAVLSLVLAEEPDGVAGQYLPTQSLYSGGWIISVGRLELTEGAGDRYLKVVFGGGEHKPEALQAPRLIGAFPAGS